MIILYPSCFFSNDVATQHCMCKALSNFVWEREGAARIVWNSIRVDNAYTTTTAKTKTTQSPTTTLPEEKKKKGSTISSNPIQHQHFVRLGFRGIRCQIILILAFRSQQGLGTLRKSVKHNIQVSKENRSSKKKKREQKPGKKTKEFLCSQTNAKCFFSPLYESCSVSRTSINVLHIPNIYPLYVCVCVCVKWGSRALLRKCVTHTHKAHAVFTLALN